MKHWQLSKNILALSLMVSFSVFSGNNTATAQIEAKFARINPDYYTANDPFQIQRLENGQTMDVEIITGAPVTAILTYADAWSLHITKPDGVILNNQTLITRDKSWTYAILYTENGISKATGFNVKYIADIIDRTPGSKTKDKRPDVIFVNKGGNAVISGGKYMEAYKWKLVADAAFSTATGSDSVRTVTVGQEMVLRANGGWVWHNDTIAIAERPTATKTGLDFGTTLNGYVYKVYKANTTGTDTAWTEVSALSFVGNGLARSVTTGVGVWKIGIKRNENAQEVQDSQPLKVDIGTEAVGILPETNFNLQGKVFTLSENAAYYIYDTSGKIVNSGYGTKGKLNSSGTYIVNTITDKGVKQTIKVIVK